MESPDPAMVAAEGAAVPSLFGRVALVFTRPAHAWNGLRERAQWWFPMLLGAVCYSLMVGVLYQRVFVPLISRQMEASVESGAMDSAGYDRVMAFMSGPMGLAVSLGQQLFLLLAIQFVFALLIWLVMSFVLGRKMTYRWSLEVAFWSWLITLPALALTGVIAWLKEDWQAAHVGLGILLPQPDRPTKLITSLGVFLDGIGPLAIWYVAVLILGAAALSGAPRKQTAWAIGTLYVVTLAFGAAVASLQVKGS